MLKKIYWAFAFSMIIFAIGLLSTIIERPLPLPGMFMTFVLELFALIVIALHIRNNISTSNASVVMAIFLTWSIITTIVMDNSSMYYLNIEPKYYIFLASSLSPLMFFAGYYFYIKRKIKTDWSTIIFVIIGFISIYFLYISLTSLKLQFEAMGKSITPVSNVGFYALCILPWVFLIKRKLLRVIIYIVFIAALIFSMKRSILVIVAAISALYMMMNIKRKTIIPLLLSVFIGGSAIVYVVNKINPEAIDFMMFRIERIQDDGGSGRTSVYKNVLQTIANQPIEYTIVGNGFNTAIKKVPSDIEHQVSAHNDFLEVLFDYGVVGIVIYLFLHLFIFKRMLYLRKKDDRFFMSYAASWIIFIIMSLVSHLVLYPTYFVFLTFYWGMVEALVQRGYFENNNYISVERKLIK